MDNITHISRSTRQYCGIFKHLGQGSTGTGGRSRRKVRSITKPSSKAPWRVCGSGLWTQRSIPPCKRQRTAALSAGPRTPQLPPSPPRLLRGCRHPLHPTPSLMGQHSSAPAAMGRRAPLDTSPLCDQSPWLSTGRGLPCRSPTPVLPALGTAMLTTLTQYNTHTPTHTHRTPFEMLWPSGCSRCSPWSPTQHSDGGGDRRKRSKLSEQILQVLLLLQKCYSKAPSPAILFLECLFHS